ncbi:UDP-N-acetylglucosamine transferase subunit ALG14 [Melopsittacus undulatus]|uniref:UDP-N-acetylglucosamine transferase subunit ALG14 n=1 Tax=Melopsittacus undulatus TaxID=13146 RepID=UPI0010883F9C|nr:UDP-N-acetylglucosamine transferase subunit ALG14 homolog [Melopsittacus undulatus]
MERPLPVAFFLLLSLLLVPLVLLARRRRSRRTPPFSLLVVAGSGGHTTEILRLLSCLSESYSPRHYVFADSDTMSEAKIRSFEQKRAETFSTSQFTLDRIPRSREVRQSWTSSVVTTLYSMLYSLPLTYRRKPDLILCNGPGTCVPVCISALLLGLLGIKRAIIVYVESICRVETLSLSGKILYYFSDYFIVQWPDLKEKYPKSIYLGRIV